MKRKWLYILSLLFLTILTTVLSACSDNDVHNEERIHIVVQIFPQYDWVRQIIGEENMYRFNLTFLLNNAIDTHSFNPSVSDMARIKTSDVFMFVGGHSDGWVNDVLGSADMNPDVVLMNLMDVLGDQPLLEGFCDDDCDEDHEHHHNNFQADEHVWLSLRFAKIICAAIADILAKVDPENADVYLNNMEAYVKKLAALDEAFRAAVDAAKVMTVVVADRFPFRYLFNDYGITHYAAFQGCSAESEASFVTVISLANRLNQLGLNFVIVTETSNQFIAGTVINSTTNRNQQIVVLDSVKSVTQNDVRNGATYLSIMERNLDVLRTVLMN